MTPLIVGLAGTAISTDERMLFGDMQPAGFILFARNIDNPRQVLELTDDLRKLSGREDAPILIDQEGGRIQRLGPPHWPQHPSAAAFGRVWDIAPMTAIEAARFHAMAIAQDLRACGINVDCLPLIDVPVTGADDVIGDRAFGGDPAMVAALGDAILTGLREAGVCGIIKHIPGHGRAEADSHKELPVVKAARADLEQDLAPFRKLSAAPMAMTAHVVYSAIDADRCASVSPIVIEEVIRREIGFDGLLMRDDLGMHALSGEMPERMHAALAAGCDLVLHCSSDFKEMRALTENAPEISAAAGKRLASAMSWAATEPEIDMDAARRRDALLAAAL